MKIISTILLATLACMTLACGYSKKTTPPVAGNMPAIATLSPNTISAGSAKFTLTVDGSNFNSNASVNWGGAAQTTAFVNGGQLTIAVPASAVTSQGTVAITVTNPGTTGTGQYGSGGTLPETSTPMTFTIN